MNDEFHVLITDLGVEFVKLDLRPIRCFINPYMKISPQTEMSIYRLELCLAKALEITEPDNEMLLFSLSITPDPNELPKTLEEATERFIRIARDSETYGMLRDNRTLSTVKEWDSCLIDLQDHRIKLREYQSRGNVTFYNKKNVTHSFFGQEVIGKPYLKVDLAYADNFLLFVLRENAADMVLAYHAHDLEYEYAVFRMDLLEDDNNREKTLETYVASDNYDDVAAYFNLYNKQVVDGELIYSMDLENAPVVLVIAEFNDSINMNIYRYHICKHAKILLQRNYYKM